MSCRIRWSGGQVGWWELVVASKEPICRCRGLPPFLEEAHTLTTAIGAPEIAPAGWGVAAVSRAVVAVTSSPHTGTPENVDQRRTSETTLLNASLSLCTSQCNWDLHLLHISICQLLSLLLMIIMYSKWSNFLELDYQVRWNENQAQVNFRNFQCIKIVLWENQEYWNRFSIKHFFIKYIFCSLKNNI